MITIKRRIEFEAAHRLIGHQGKCKYLHGHRYILEVNLSFAELDEMGMAIDFAVVKERLNGWINDNWDHNVILDKRDQSLIGYINQETGQNVYVMNVNPTAENMALYLKNQVIPRLFKEFAIKEVSVILFETTNCGAMV